MNKQEYIKKIMTILGEHIYGCNAEDCSCPISEEVQALYQLHLEGVREELDKYRKELNELNPECDCDCGAAYCNNLVHQCKKPKEHTSQADWMFVKFKLEVLDDIWEKLKK